MLSATYSQFGDPATVLGLEDRPVPQPGPGEIRVRMQMASIHNHDLLTIQGLYGIRPHLPAAAGTEAMGLVDALGEGVAHLQVGQRVAASGGGTWAEYYIAPAASAVPLPNAIDDTAAAQLVSMPLSALALLDFVAAAKGDVLIQNAANGAVGKALALFARKRGVRVINLVRRDEAVRELADLGIEDAVSTGSEGWRERVRGLVGDGVLKAAIDGVGGPASGDLLSVLDEKGVLVSFGLMSGRPMELSASDMIFKQAVVKGFWLAKVGPAIAPDRMKAMVAEIVQAVAAGDVVLSASKVVDLADATKAVAAAAQSGRKGKVLIRG